MSLREIFCQDRAVGAIQRAMGAERIAHSYIFAGPNGTGRYKTAFEWARVLLCEAPVNTKDKNGVFHDSCGTCAACALMDSGTHPDYIHLYKELYKFTEKGAKTDREPLEFPIDVVREMLIETANKRPMHGKRKIYVVSEAEKVNNASQNAMLKVLEEPPAYCMIILLCTRMEALLPTTKSRCQIIRFGPIDENIIVEKLAGMGVSKNEGLYWARLCQGSLGSAMFWAELRTEDMTCFTVKRELVQRLARVDLPHCLETAEWLGASAKTIAQAMEAREDDVSKKDINRRAQKGILWMALSVFHDALHQHMGADRKLVNEDQKEAIKSVTMRYDAEKCAENVSKIYENMRWVDASVNEKLNFEELLLHLCGCGTITDSMSA